MLGTRLQELRKSKGLSKKALASILDVHETTYGKYELGHREPNADTIKQLAEYFGVTTDYLLGSADDPAPADAKKVAEGEITFDDFEFALYGEVRELNDEEKAELLKNAQRMNELRKLRNKAADGGE